MTTRIIGIGLIPDRETNLRLARNHGYRTVFSELDDDPYVELPDIGVDVHKRHHEDVDGWYQACAQQGALEP